MVVVDFVEEFGVDGYFYGYIEINGKCIDLVVCVDGCSYFNVGEIVMFVVNVGYVYVFDIEFGDCLNDKLVVFV